MGRVYQAVPISITVEGANLLTRNMIIFGQGAIRSHPFIFEELEAVNEAQWDVSLKKFDRALFGHMRFFFSNLLRTFFHGLTGGYFSHWRARNPSRRYYQKLTRMSAAFALFTDVAVMSLGASLKRKERISARLGDVLSQLYLASAVMKHFHSQGAQREDTPLMRWSVEMCLYRVQQAMDELLQNFPNRPVAWLLRVIIFPWGRRYRIPSDKLGAQIAELLMTPGAARDRLTEGVYFPSEDNEPLVQLEDALEKVIKAEPVERRLRSKVKGYEPGFQTLEPMLARARSQLVLTEEEVKLLRQAEAARWQVIQVDDFDTELK
jgi:acyl-CoA dehydrogenase